MGKPSPPPQGPSDDAVSLDTQPGDRYLDDDDAPEVLADDLPPLYEDVASDGGAPLLPAQRWDMGSLTSFTKDASTGAEAFLSSRLDADPQLLEEQVNLWATQPPRFYCRLRGTHQQTVDNNGKKEKREVVDFDVQVDLTPYLYSDAANRKSWRALRTAENEERVRRGTVLRKRAPGACNGLQLGQPKPSLAEWCHRYCASSAGLKCFALLRRVTGFDKEAVKGRLGALVRGTNYRGRVSITFSVKDDRVELYNDCKTNAWRLTSWVFWLCVFTLAFVLTWPYLFFRTKRFEVVVVEWPFSQTDAEGRRQFVSISEDQWYNMWGRAINRAVIEKRQCTLDQQDLVSAEGAPASFGNATVDNALGFFRAGVDAMNAVNRQLGWGGDS